ncbi:MAG: DUF2061 domain-containing protein [Gemmatimonadetes bacterium]|nr:DUF2061 domain-containing protein [Gemmatimonadota bacterium]
MSDSRGRSILKSLSWRIVATATTILIVLAFTGEIELAVTIGGVEIVAKLLIFYVHERTWQRVR